MYKLGYKDDPQPFLMAFFSFFVETNRKRCPVRFPHFGLFWAI